MARLTRGGRLTGAFGLALALAGSAAGQSQPIPDTMPLAAAEAASTQDTLADIEASISLSKERVAKLKAEIEAMQGDRDKQNAALIAAGERMKLAEADVATVEQKI